MSVAIVILNWNTKIYLEKFVPLIMERTKIVRQGSALGSTSSFRDNASLFVADNGSTDGSVEWLQWAYPQQEVKIIQFDKNYGFTGGYNRAFAEISKMGGNFKYYLLLNSDIEVTEGWLETLVEFMDSHPRCGACAPKILSYYNREYFEHAGAAGGFVDRYYFPYCRGRILNKIEKDEGQYDNPCKVFWVSGAALMIRARIWERYGGLDESFFAHFEEIDLCWRLQRFKWQIWSVPTSKIYHIGGGTLPNNSPDKLYFNFRNNLLMLYKNLPDRDKKRIIPFRKFLDGCIAIIYLITGKISFFRSVIRAHKDYNRMRSEVKIIEGKVELKRPKETLFSLIFKKERTSTTPNN